METRQREARNWLFRSVIGAFLATFALVTVSISAQAAQVPWKTPTYTLVARDMSLRSAIDSFAVSQGLSVVMSDAVSGVFSGDFRDMDCQEFLDRLATVHNLAYYYDGSALYLYGAGEVQTLLLDLQYMKAGEVRQMLVELGVEDSRFPLRTASNDELIMVSGPPRYVAIVAEMIAKADKLREMRTFNEVEVRMFPLRYTWADDVSFSVTSPESSLTIKGVARMIEDMMNNDLNSNVATPGSEGATNRAPQSTFRPIIRPENRLNAVVVRDVKNRLPMYETLVKQLDVPQKLVEISLTVVELSRSDALDWQLSLGLATSHGHSNYGGGQNVDNIMSPDGLLGKGLAGAMTHIHSSYALSASLSALKEKGKARSISRTTIVTVNNLAAQITDTQSYHARIVGTEVASLEEVSAGTRLTVKPRIITAPTANAPKQVWLTMDLDDGGFEAISVDSMPMTRTSRLQTQMAVFEDESILLAGYLRDIEEEAGWGIPWLRDIPIIGWLFGGASTHKETVQRMFVVTPRVVDLDEELLLRLQAGRLRNVSEIELLEDDAEISDEARAKRDKAREAVRKERHDRERQEAKAAKEAAKAAAKAEEAAAEDAAVAPVKQEPVVVPVPKEEVVVPVPVVPVPKEEVVPAPREEEPPAPAPVIEDLVVTPVPNEEVVVPVTEEVAPVIEEEPPAPAPVLEDLMVAPVQNEEVVAPMTEEVTPVIVAPVIEEAPPAPAPVMEDSMVAPVQNEEVVVPAPEVEAVPVPEVVPVSKEEPPAPVLAIGDLIVAPREEVIMPVPGEEEVVPVPNNEEAAPAPVLEEVEVEI